MATADTVLTEMLQIQAEVRGTLRRIEGTSKRLDARQAATLEAMLSRIPALDALVPERSRQYATAVVTECDTLRAAIPLYVYEELPESSRWGRAGPAGAPPIHVVSVPGREPAAWHIADNVSLDPGDTVFSLIVILSLMFFVMLCYI
jgi:hypothetical protein